MMTMKVTMVPTPIEDSSLLSVVLRGVEMTGIGRGCGCGCSFGELVTNGGTLRRAMAVN